MKKFVSSIPCLALVAFADHAIPLELVTDPSGFALVSILLIWEDTAVCSIAYNGRKLIDAEQNCSAMDRKLLGVVDSRCHFYHCLLGCEFRVATDHKPVLYYFSLSS